MYFRRISLVSTPYLYPYLVGSMMHIQVAFQIFKELVSIGEQRMIEDFVKSDNKVLVCSESTDIIFLKDKVSDLQFKVITRTQKIKH